MTFALVSASSVLVVLLTLAWAKEFRLRRALQSLLARVFIVPLGIQQLLKDPSPARQLLFQTEWFTNYFDAFSTLPRGKEICYRIKVSSARMFFFRLDLVSMGSR